jgi:AraC family transcriptional activator FtrA
VSGRDVIYRYDLAMHEVMIPVIDGMKLFEIAVAYEVFGEPRPGLVEPGYHVVLCAVSGHDTVLGSGLVAPGTHTLAELACADTIVLPALPSYDAVIPTELIDALRAAAARGTRIAAICTGAFAAAQAGLLDGLVATTHWMYADELARRHPDVQVDADVLYTVDTVVGSTAQICTSAGTAAGLDLCLELVRRDHGSAVAADVARRLVVPPHRTGGQAQFVATPIPRGLHDSGISACLDWLRAHLAEDITVKDIAAQANTSARTINRQFADVVGMAPITWLTHQRVTHAQQLLEKTELSVAQVATDCGFGTAANLRKHFTRYLSVTPSGYRGAFAAKTG